MNTFTVAAPVQQSERITLLDSLRGFAILGILLMNIPSFGLPDAVAADPTLLPDATGWNLKVWYFIGLFVNGTQRAIFSMLFGAGMILFISRQEKKLTGLEPADYFFRRQLWLMVFGVFDIYILLWYGDILFDYACVGMLLFAFRKLSARHLMIAAAVALCLQTIVDNRFLYEDKDIIQKGLTVAAIDTTKTTLTLSQKSDMEQMLAIKNRSTRESKLKNMQLSVEQMQGNYASVYKHRIKQYIDNLLNWLYYGCWDVIIFMLLGMAFYKMGILTGDAKPGLYWALFIGGLGIGFLLSWLRVRYNVDNGFNRFEFIKNAPMELYEVARTFRSLGIFGLLMVMYKSGLFKWLFALMRPVGQMAFTNYLLQSIICGIYFYGIGFGNFGKLERYQLFYVVAAVWVFEIILSHLWMRKYQYGPFEWLWRSLNYWKWQPFKK